MQKESVQSHDKMQGTISAGRKTSVTTIIKTQGHNKETSTFWIGRK